ncbi:MAG: opioid growth factor receptor-related protein [Bryobacteraceae bacterium]
MSGGERLLEFYSGRGRDDRGRLLREILAWPDDTLEDVHDYIQWLFPLTEPSAFNPRAPLLDQAAIREFRRSDDLRRAVTASFERMLRFYGFEMAPDLECEIHRAPNFAERAREWLYPMNHNHLRITRILKCLRLVGLEAQAAAFFAALEKLYNEDPRPGITAETFRYWREAAGAQTKRNE